MYNQWRKYHSPSPAVAWSPLRVLWSWERTARVAAMARCDSSCATAESQCATAHTSTHATGELSAVARIHPQTVSVLEAGGLLTAHSSRVNIVQGAQSCSRT
eukprot:scaffold4450_cov444-Prasinococcus_capsulatus_cf.AAC.3